MTSSLITNIEVKGLFGLYTYRLPVEGTLPDAAILYGDNGVGKSTVLRLAFHLLSPARNRAHRTALQQIHFDELSVQLGSGVTITAVKSPKTPETLRLSLRAEKRDLAVWEFRPKHLEHAFAEGEQYALLPDGRAIRTHRGRTADKVSGIQGERIYLEELAKHVPTVFILNADRRLDSDAVADPSDEVELRRVMQFGEPRRIHDLVVRSREIALTQALSAAAKWINRQVFQGANQGSTNVHAVYGNVLRHLVQAPRRAAEERPTDLSTLLSRLSAIEATSKQYARYELSAPLSTTEFVAALSTRAAQKRNIAVSLLEPYVESLEGRLSALSGVFGIVDRFVNTVNAFLQDKLIAFTPSAGFSINNKLGVALSPAQLSSGEQQLLLLFCYVLTARDTPSVFMIDEPEISLNIKWQRQLVQSLLDLTDRSTTQFLFASHSMELLSQHRERVVRLKPQGAAG